MQRTLDPQQRDGAELEQLVDLVEQLCKRARSRVVTAPNSIQDIASTLDYLSQYARAHRDAQGFAAECVDAYGARLSRLQTHAAELGIQAGVHLRRARAIAKTLKIGSLRRSA